MYTWNKEEKKYVKKSDTRPETSYIKSKTANKPLNEESLKEKAKKREEA